MRPTSITARCLRQTEWRSPWKPDGVIPRIGATHYPRWLKFLKNQAGVYAVRDVGTKEWIYVGRSTKDLKKTIVRHFAGWNPRSWWRQWHHHWTCDRTKVEVKIYLVRDPRHAYSVEADLIALHRPRDNRRLEIVNATQKTNRIPGEDDGPIPRRKRDRDASLFAEESVPF